MVGFAGPRGADRRTITRLCRPPISASSSAEINMVVGNRAATPCESHAECHTALERDFLGGDMNDGGALAGVDPDKPSPARLYDFYLGGEHNFPIDRAAGERLRAAMPDLEDAAWANRGFLGRAAQWL